MFRTIIALTSTASIALGQMTFETYETLGFLRHRYEINTQSDDQRLFDVQYKCQYLADMNIYDLQPLALANPFYHFSDVLLNDYYVSFCNDLPSDKSCGTSTMATLYPPVGSCKMLSGANPTTNAVFSVGNATSQQDLVIDYTGSVTGCGNNGDTFSLQVYIQCGDELIKDKVVDQSDPCKPFIRFSSTVGCKKDQLSGLWQWFKSNKWAMFAVFIVVGFVVCFFGRTLFKPVIFIAGVFLSVGVVWIIFYSTFLSTNTESWVGWVVLACSIAVGLIVGFLFIKFIKVGVFVLAGFGGYTLGLLLYNAILYKMNSQVGFWCITLGFALVAGILAHFLFEHVLIHATAFFGSFLFIYGIGLVAGRYQNPFTIVAEINNGVLDNIDPVFYAYFAGNIILYLLGAIWQYRQRQNDRHTGKDPYERLRS